jgi:hypothetical protein
MTRKIWQIATMVNVGGYGGNRREWSEPVRFGHGKVDGVRFFA